MVITNSFSRSSLKLSWMIILPYTHSGYVCFIADNPLGECLKAVILFSQCCVQLQDKMLYNEIFEFKLQYKKNAVLRCKPSQLLGVLPALLCTSARAIFICHVSHLPRVSNANCILMKALIPLDQCSAVLLMCYFQSCLVECAEEETFETSLPRIEWDIFFLVLWSSMKCAWSVNFYKQS